MEVEAGTEYRRAGGADQISLKRGRDMKGLVLVAAIVAASIGTVRASCAGEDAARAKYEAALDAAVKKYPLKAILIGISEGSAEPWFAARGETMTGVRATPD